MKFPNTQKMNYTRLSKEIKSMITMMLCIIDPAGHIPSLKTLFPEADYFSHEPDDFFKYTTTNHYNKEQFEKEHGFSYRTDWEKITQTNYQHIFIVAPLLDYYSPLSSSLVPYLNNMLSKLRSILIQNTFKTVALFDVYDYDYDPNEINTEIRVDYYFKRNYQKGKSYKSNVFPFPCMMFVKPCVLNMVLNKDLYHATSRKNTPMWAGALYNHIDTNFNPPIERKRKEMYDSIKDSLVTYSNLQHNDYLQKIREHKILVDLIGVGDPNKRFFEGISNGTLVMTMTNNLDWGFYPGDEFHSGTVFSTPSEYHQKVQRLLVDQQFYNECLFHQNKLVEKYFTKEWLRTYIEKKIGIHDKVTLFVTACKRPDLLKTTLESFVKYNTYPIEEVIIMEDSGLQGVDDFAHSIFSCPVRILYTKKNRGVMRSIENGLQYIRTPYVFQSEDDWEFYDYGFIEKSFEILKKNTNITVVQLRSYEDLSRYNFPLVKKENYYTCGTPENNIGNFTNNPGLRTTQNTRMFAPYTLETIPTLCEGGLCSSYRKLGMTSALTDNPNGYVAHTGWGRRVYGTLQEEKF